MKISTRIKQQYKSLASNIRSKFPTLKSFVRSLLQFGSDDEKRLAKQWLDHKRGSLEKAAKKEREKLKGTLNRTIAAASKAARRKIKPGGKSQSAK